MGIVKNKPFLLEPAGKDYLWGGTRLKTDFNKKINLDPLAETWECSTHPDGVSTVVTGIFQGKKLDEVIKNNPEFLGTRSAQFEQFPIMIKFIDAKKDLSVQVHPDDEYARVNENGSLGKMEMWYVLDATPEAQLVYGFNRNITKEELKNSINSGNVEKHLQKVNIKKGDVFFIPAGQVHAICSGALIAEIQENSNITYRLYDYNRTDKNGKKRELHIDKAIDVANLKASTEPKQPMRVIRFKKGYVTELLSRCKYFQVEKVLLNAVKDEVEYKTNELSFHVLLCIDGTGKMKFDDECLNFSKGDCIFVPANSISMKMNGNASFLDVNC